MEVDLLTQVLGVQHSKTAVQVCIATHIVYAPSKWTKKDKTTTKIIDNKDKLQGQSRRRRTRRGTITTRNDIYIFICVFMCLYALGWKYVFMSLLWVRVCGWCVRGCVRKCVHVCVCVCRCVCVCVVCVCVCVCVWYLWVEVHVYCGLQICMILFQILFLTEFLLYTGRRPTTMSGQNVSTGRHQCCSSKRTNSVLLLNVRQLIAIRS